MLAQFFFRLKETKDHNVCKHCTKDKQIKIRKAVNDGEKIGKEKQKHC